MKPSVDLRLNQQLVLTPQLQQAIGLLQLSKQELQTELRQLAESNPMLEFVEDDTPVDPAPESTTSLAAADDGPAWDNTPARSDAGLDFSARAPAPLPASDMEPGIQDAAAPDLREHLRWQVQVAGLPPRRRLIAELIIDDLNTDGYLQSDVETLATSLSLQPALGIAEVNAERRQIQLYDPTGVASIDLADCLDVQLSQLSPDTPQLPLARRVARECLDLLAHNDQAAIAGRLRAAHDDVATCCALIRQLDPRPGAALDNTPVEYVVPEAVAWYDGRQWQVQLNPSGQPHLGLNEHYCELIGKANRGDASWMRGQLQEARRLLKALETRADTVLRVARAIVAHQHAFLDFGAEAMRPLVLREIAEQIGMHESTISRVTTRKYLNTPRGNIEFKAFFSVGVTTEDGTTVSATAIRATLHKLIEAEDTHQPLSDQALAAAFRQRGINVARRTIAKYRETLHIPRSSDRRQRQ